MQETHRQRKIRFAEYEKAGIPKRQYTSFSRYSNRRCFFQHKSLNWMEYAPLEHWQRATYTTEEMYKKYVESKDGGNYYMCMTKELSDGGYYGEAYYVYAKTAGKAKVEAAYAFNCEFTEVNVRIAEYFY